MYKKMLFPKIALGQDSEASSLSINLIFCLQSNSLYPGHGS